MIPNNDWAGAYQALLLLVGAFVGLFGGVTTVAVGLAVMWRVGIKIGLAPLLEALRESVNFREIVDGRITHKNGDDISSISSQIQMLSASMRYWTRIMDALLAHMRATGQLNGFTGPEPHPEEKAAAI